ncbi:MAG: superfamily protein [Rhizobium sp.]|nr:superfamily protein [Rhizobium sp.]
MNEPKLKSGLAQIESNYDAFLVDQFGVLRDGRGPYPEAAATLVALKALGKKIIILSNSGKRSEENSVRLAQLGFDPQSWDWFLTSGETAWRIMQTETRGSGQKRCLLISRDNDTSPLDGLDIVRTDSAEDADVILIAASEGDVHTLADYQALLEPAVRRNIPCLCTNPDKIMLTRGGTAFGAGRIAELFEALGGTVRWIGKPFPDIYNQARDFLGNIPPARICAIGDSVEHDIAGARDAGFASILVTTGILEHASPVDRQNLFEVHQAVPDFILPMFRM